MRVVGSRVACVRLTRLGLDSVRLTRPGLASVRFARPGLASVRFARPGLVRSRLCGPRLMRCRLIGTNLGQLDRVVPLGWRHRTLPEPNVVAVAGCGYLLVRRRAVLELDIRLPVAR